MLLQKERRNRNAIAQEYKVVDSPDYGVEYISDHYPIIAKLILN